MSEHKRSARRSEPDAIARLVRVVGKEAPIDPKVAARVGEVVREEWQREVSGRRRRGAFMWLIAAVLLLSVASLLWLRSSTPLASIAQVEGEVWTLRGQDRSGVEAAMALDSGTELWTGDNGRASLEMAGGGSLRVNAATRLVFLDRARVRLDEGGLYFDSESVASTASNTVEPVQIQTPFGTVVNRGTRYLVEVDAGRMRVLVRSGEVEVDRAGAEPVTVRSGGSLVLDRNNSAQAGKVQRFGPDWDWTLEMASPFALDGSRLGPFLDWVSRETGLDVRFAAALDEPELRSITLRGSVDGLRPDRAALEVLPLCGLEGLIEGATLWIRQPQ